MNDIDTKTRHVTLPGANLFVELGFDLTEAEQLKPDKEAHQRHQCFERRANG